MAIEWEKIEGYVEGMSDEEKLELLEKTDFGTEKQPPEPPSQSEPKTPPHNGKTISKAQFDKISSELAAAKKQLREKMTAEEAREAERQEEQEQIKQELELLRKEKQVSNYTAAFMSLKCDEQTAKAAAAALADGDTDAMFDYMKKSFIAMEKSIRTQILKDTPTPPAGDDDKSEEARKQAEMRRWFGLPER